MLWRKVTLIGVGLLGGSLGLALKKRALTARIEGYVRREASIDECIQTGAVDSAGTDLAAAVRGANLIVFCTPLAQITALAEQCAPAVERGAIITDVGSVKAALVRELTPLFAARAAHFVGSHPMAGSEKMGVAAARADLFENAVSVVTPARESSEPAVARIEELWRNVGAAPLRMSPEVHDELVSRSSHLPHVLAANLAGYVLDSKSAPEQSRLCAGGFRDGTRVASGSPEMWRDIVLMNRPHLLRSLGEFSARLAEFQALLEKADPAELFSFFQHAKALRDGFAAKCASTSPE